jgi:hypothetical protein
MIAVDSSIYTFLHILKAFSFMTCSVISFSICKTFSLSLIFSQVTHKSHFTEHCNKTAECTVSVTNIMKMQYFLNYLRFYNSFVYIFFELI